MREENQRLVSKKRNGRGLERVGKEGSWRFRRIESVRVLLRRLIQQERHF